MDEYIKMEMKILREEGFGYKKIAKKLNLNKNTVASYFQRKNIFSPTVYCKNCGYKIINMNRMGRKKKFCCKKCRLIYYKLKSNLS